MLDETVERAIHGRTFARPRRRERVAADSLWRSVTVALRGARLGALVWLGSVKPWPDGVSQTSPYACCSGPASSRRKSSSRDLAGGAFRVDALDAAERRRVGIRELTGCHNMRCLWAVAAL